MEAAIDLFLDALRVERGLAENTLAAYRRVNELAMRVLSRDGILVSCSCSYPLPLERFLSLLQGAARHIDRQMQILEVLHQGPDHPIHPAIPETAYLKGVIARVLPS